MPKFMLQASYTAEGLKGLIKDKASARKAAITKLVEAAGGRLEAMYYTFGKDDVFLIVDLPDNATAAAISLTVSATGLVRGRTTPLLTIEETDRALGKNLAYKAPGH